MSSLIPSRLWAMGLAIVLTAATANAATLDVTLNNVSPSQTFGYSTNGGSSYKSTKAGVFNWTRTGGSHVGDPVGNFRSFCVELTQNISPGSSYTYDVVAVEDAPNDGFASGMGTAKAALLSELWGRFYSPLFDADQAAAFQVSVWEIVYDGGVDLAAGSFQAQSLATGFVTLSQTWLNVLDGTGAMANLGAMTNPNRQDHIYELPTPTNEQIPAPAAATAGLMGLGLLGIGRKRRSA